MIKLMSLVPISKINEQPEWWTDMSVAQQKNIYLHTKKVNIKLFPTIDIR